MKLSEKTQTGINLIAKFVSYGSSLLISFFLTPYLVNNLGSEEYSFYPMANNFINCLAPITIALNSMASRYITIAFAKKEKDKVDSYFSSIFFGNVIISVIITIPSFILIYFLDLVLDIPIGLEFSVKLLFSLVFISMIVNILSNVLGVAVFATNKLYLSSIASIVEGFIRIILYIFLFSFFKPSIVFVGIVTLVTSITIALFQAYYTKKLLPTVKISFKIFKWATIREVTSSGVWNSINQVGIVLMSSFNLMLCNSLYGATAGGSYSIALTVPHFLSSIVSLITSVFLPGLTIRYATKTKKEMLNYLYLSQETIGIIINIPISIFLIIGKDFFSLWTPNIDSSVLYIYSIFAVSYQLVTSITWPLNNLNIITNNVKIPALVMLITGMVNIVLNFIFYYFTSLGPYSIPVVQAILFILNRGIFICIYTALTLNEKWYKFYQPILKNLESAICIILLGSLFNLLCKNNTWSTLIGRCIVLCALGVGINMYIWKLNPKILIRTRYSNG